ncbi:MAG: CHRD domain-containing protein [Pyrinomonadaceae bacterium]
MTGSQVVPLVNTNGSGLALATLNQGQNRLAIALAFGPLSSKPTSAHIHGPAPIGQNGPILFDLGPVTAVKLGTAWYGVTPVRTLNLTAPMAAQLLAGAWYVDVHTQNRPSGEIRGQIRQIYPPNGQLASIVKGQKNNLHGSVIVSKDLLGDILNQINQSRFSPYMDGGANYRLALFDLQRLIDLDQFGKAVESALDNKIITTNDSP